MYSKYDLPSSDSQDAEMFRISIVTVRSDSVTEPSLMRLSGEYPSAGKLTASTISCCVGFVVLVPVATVEDSVSCDDEVSSVVVVVVVVVISVVCSGTNDVYVVPSASVATVIYGGITISVSCVPSTFVTVLPFGSVTGRIVVGNAVTIVVTRLPPASVTAVPCASVTTNAPVVAVVVLLVVL